MSEMEAQGAPDESKYDGGKKDKDKSKDKSKDKQGEQSSESSSANAADKTGSDADNRKGTHGQDQPKTAAK